MHTRYLGPESVSWLWFAFNWVLIGFFLSGGCWILYEGPTLLSQIAVKLLECQSRCLLPTFFCFLSTPSPHIERILVHGKNCFMRKPVLTTLPTQLTHISPFMCLSDKDCVSGNNILQGIGVLYSVSPMLDARWY